MRPLRTIAYAFGVMLFLLLSVSVGMNMPIPPNTPPGIGLDNMPRIGVDADYNFSATAIGAEECL